MHPVHEQLPEDLRAATPGEVAAVVQIREATVKMGQYTTGQNANQTQWQVSVVDPKTGQLLARRVFRGIAPPDVIKSGEKREPEPPSAEAVVNWLRGSTKGGSAGG